MVPAIFFQSRNQTGIVHIFTEEKIKEIQSLHLSGKTQKEICEQTGIKSNTYSKAVSQKRLILPCVTIKETSLSTKSFRNIQDNESGMGKSCTNAVDRVLD
jgi:hypothetical protein